MEVSDSYLNTLAVHLKQTLDPDPNVRRPAEKFLESVETNLNYPILLLRLIEKDNVNMTSQIAGAVAFKNYTQRNWRVADEQLDKIHANDRIVIKHLIVGLMMKSPKQIQRLLGDAVSVIGREDFPKKWQNLLPEMASNFQTGNCYAINGILRTAHSLFKRYRYERKSPSLWEEIQFVVDNFAQPFTDLFEATMKLAETNASNPEALKVVFNSLVSIAKVFYSLNFQDLPEFFKDNVEIWMPNFLTLLSSDNQILKTGEDEEAGVLEQLKSQICENVTLYAQKYNEEFAPYLPQFFTAVWSLLSSTGQQLKYDALVSNAIRFLCCVAERDEYKSLFEAANVLGSVCEKVVIPNIEFRECDEELFEDNPEEYIRRDIEGSDVETRRGATCELVKALIKLFEAQITAVFSQYITAMLENYNVDPNCHWKSKDAAIYLVTSITATGETGHDMQTNHFVNVLDFYKDHILTNLQSSNVDELPLLKADSLKCLVIFRGQLPRDVIWASIPSVINLLTAKSNVVHTYAAHAVECIFTLKADNGTQCFNGEDIQPIAEWLLNNLFATMSHYKGSNENEYIIIAIMRVVSAMHDLVSPFLSIMAPKYAEIPGLLAAILPKLTMILRQVSMNRTNAQFNQYLFETLSLAIRVVFKSNRQAIATFEEALLPMVGTILEQDIPEFLPDIFQLLSFLVDAHKHPAYYYMSIFPSLLVPTLWEIPGIIHPILQLLLTYIKKCMPSILAPKLLGGVFGVCKKLISSKSNYHEGFFILRSLLQELVWFQVKDYMSVIFVVLFEWLWGSKTTEFEKCFLVFLFHCAFSSGSQVINMIDEIQNGMFGEIIGSLVLSDLQKISGTIERKICAVGIVQLLTESPEFISGTYSKYWISLLQTLIALFELPEDDSVPDDEPFMDIEDTPTYPPACCKMAFIGIKELDPLPKVSDPRLRLAKGLKKLTKNNPGKFSSMISSLLGLEELRHLNRYLQAANIQLP